MAFPPRGTLKGADERIHTNVARVVGLVWYDFEDYDAIRRIMADGDKLPNTFSEWRTKAEAVEKRLRREGDVVVRALIDPETFPE